MRRRIGAVVSRDRAAGSAVMLIQTAAHGRDAPTRLRALQLGRLLLDLGGSSPRYTGARLVNVHNGACMAFAHRHGPAVGFARGVPMVNGGIAETEVLGRLARWAESDERIRALILESSRAGDRGRIHRKGGIECRSTKIAWQAGSSLPPTGRTSRTARSVTASSRLHAEHPAAPGLLLHCRVACRWDVLCRA
jgi:hypothetical protein